MLGKELPVKVCNYAERASGDERRGTHRQATAQSESRLEKGRQGRCNRTVAKERPFNHSGHKAMDRLCSGNQPLAAAHLRQQPTVQRFHNVHLSVSRFATKW